MLVLLVQFTVKPGTEPQAREYIRKMQEHTRREPGCRLYIGQQSTEDPRRFCFYEQYDDPAALDAHRAAPYFAEYVTHGLSKLMESRTQEFFTPMA
jgi:quinol monooxygenase YgiN